jgi:hypothetical protein
MSSQLPPGIYRITVAGGVEPACLTRNEQDVTILPPGARPDPEQEVIHCFLTSSIVCRSRAILVDNPPCWRWQHNHRETHPDLSRPIPYLR